MSGKLHGPAALTPWKEPPVPLGQKTGWAPEPVWVRWSSEKITSLLLPGIERRSSSL